MPSEKELILANALQVFCFRADPNLNSEKSNIRIAGGGLSNDANHISGPSRTGEELGFAIQQALEEAGMTSKDIDFISAHGTATLYNDEMEAKAFNLMDLKETPLNSLKGYYGHTLGAAGIVETIISAQSLKEDELIPTAGFESVGVTQTVNVIKKIESQSLENMSENSIGFWRMQCSNNFTKRNLILKS